MMENPIKMDDLGVPLFLETPIYNPNQPGPLLSLLNCFSLLASRSEAAGQCAAGIQSIDAHTADDP